MFLMVSEDRDASFKIVLSCPAKSTERPLRWTGVEPILSKTSVVSAIKVLILGAKLEPRPSAIVLTLSAKQAAKDIMIAVLFGIDLSWFSPCTATRSTLSADERPAARK